ncbi:MAG TPA: NAD(P)(+) transhydrogenase (Re/Si-specific) subunit beta, partial [Bryobacteraceae bacterium]|nr:NAD(P)(+) transhydrogenase (Re/Si-specific) subunit beta [Bryobacteraceae bacterium]
MSVYQFLYILAAFGFILGLKWMSSPVTSRRGVLTAEAGMLVAIVGTLLRGDIVNYQTIAIAIVLGTIIGAPIAIFMPMTGVPQRTAISQACGALASALIGTAEYYKLKPHGFTMGALIIETLLGFLTVTASVMAWGKLQEVLPGRPVTYKGQFFVNMGVLAAAIVIGVA